MAVEKLEFGGFEVCIDPEKMRFDETSLTEYIQCEFPYYDNIGHYLSLAERNLQNLEVTYERLYHERFVESKEMGGSDKLAEAKAKSDPDVIATKQDIVDAKYIVNRLKRHLSALDKNHDNAQSLGHMLRKSMDKLNTEIMARIHNVDPREIVDLDKTVDETVTPVETETDTDTEFETDLSSGNFF